MSIERKDLQTIFSFLKSLHFHFLDDWVIQCVNYCKSTNPNIPLESLKDFVKEQWLLVNLRLIKVPSLPPDLTSQHKTILPGKFVVQVESMTDCSRSCYSQLQTLQRINTENIEFTKAFNEGYKREVNRCLIFEISDGVQELKAMEYEPIRKIKTNDPELLPGFKMLIIGPVECRKGMILLKEENVKVYGGEVDTLAITNNIKSVLMRKLDLSEEDLPESRFSDDKTGNNDSNLENQITNLEKIDSENVEKLLSQNNELFLSLPFENEIFPSETHSNNAINSEFNINNDIVMTESENNVRINEHLDNHNNINESIFNNDFMAKFRKHSLPIEEKTAPSSKKLYYNSKTDSNDFLSEKVVKAQNLPNFFIENWEESNKIENCQEPMQITLPDCFQSSSNATVSSVPNHISNTVTNQYEIHTSSTVNKKSNLLNDISPRPFVYLKQIMSIKFCSPCTFTIKAIILTLKKKITIENEMYNLKGIITDGSHSMEAEFSSNIVEDFLEYSPCEMQAMMKDKHLNTAISDRIKEAFLKAQEKFISLNCLMNIKFFPNSEIPLVLSLEEVASQHLNFLKLRTKIPMHRNDSV